MPKGERFFSQQESHTQESKPRLRTSPQHSQARCGESYARFSATK